MKKVCFLMLLFLLSCKTLQGPSGALSQKTETDTTPPTLPSFTIQSNLTVNLAENLVFPIADMGSDSGGSGYSHLEYIYTADGVDSSVFKAIGVVNGLYVNNPVTHTSYQMKIRSVDKAGNTSAWVTSSYTIYYDNTIPISASFAAAANSITQTASSVSFTVSAASSDAGAGFSHYEYIYIQNGIEGSVNVTAGAVASIAVSAPITNTVYQLKLRAVDLAGNKSEWIVSPNAIVFDTTIPSTVSGLKVNDSTVQYVSAVSQAPILSWNAATDTGYTGAKIQFYQIDTNNDGTPETGMTALTATSYTLPSTAGTYNIKVRSVDAAGNYGAWSSIFPLTVYNPTVSASFSAASNTITQTASAVSFTVSSTGTGFSHYEYIYIQNGIEGSVNVTAGAVASIAVPAPITNTVYQLKLRAVDLGGNKSDWVVSPNAIVFDTAIPSTVSGLKVNDSSTIQFVSAVSQSPILSWNESTDTGYTGAKIQYYQIDTNNDGTPEAGMTAIGTTFYTFPNTESSYNIKVRSVDMAGNFGAWSSAFTLTVDNTNPSVPSIQSFTALGGGSFEGQIQWNEAGDPNGIESYVVEIVLSSSGQRAWLTLPLQTANSNINNGGIAISDPSDIVDDETAGYLTINPYQAVAPNYTVQIKFKNPGGTYMISIKAKDKAGNTGIASAFSSVLIN